MWYGGSQPRSSAMLQHIHVMLCCVLALQALGQTRIFLLACIEDDRCKVSTNEIVGERYGRVVAEVPGPPGPSVLTKLPLLGSDMPVCNMTSRQVCDRVNVSM